MHNLHRKSNNRVNPSSKHTAPEYSNLRNHHQQRPITHAVYLTVSYVTCWPPHSPQSSSRLTNLLILSFASSPLPLNVKSVLHSLSSPHPPLSSSLHAYSSLPASLLSHSSPWAPETSEPKVFPLAELGHLDSSAGTLHIYFPLTVIKG